MLKNLLYSIFLHLIILMIIQGSIRRKEKDLLKSKEIVVSLTPIKESQIISEEKKPEDSLDQNKDDSDEKLAAEEKRKEQQRLDRIKKENELAEEKKRLEDLKKKQEADLLAQKKAEEEAIKKAEEEKIKAAEELKRKAEEEKQKLEQAKKKAEDEKRMAAEKKKKAEEDRINSILNPANRIENINLSQRERINIQDQLKSCYKQALKETKLTKSNRIFVKVEISKTGNITFKPRNVLTVNEKDKQPNFEEQKLTIITVKKAIDLCSPLRNLPNEKYEVWREVVLEFEEQND
jgi:hypothetical protein